MREMASENCVSSVLSVGRREVQVGTVWEAVKRLDIRVLCTDVYWESVSGEVGSVFEWKFGV